MDFDLMLKEDNGLFIEDEYLKCASVDSITWHDERHASVTMTILFEYRKYLALIKDGITIDLMRHLCSGSPRIRENYMPVLEFHRIYNIDKTMFNPVINHPDDNERLDIVITFDCSLVGVE